MTDTTFTNTTTPIVASWLQDVNNTTYKGMGPGGVPGASISTYLSSGTGAQSTTVQNKLRESVSVEDFGANSSDTIGTTNRLAIQAALDSGSSNIYFPKMYTVNGPLYFKTNQRLYSNDPQRGSCGITFKIVGTTNISLFSPETTSSEDIELSGLTIYISASSTFVRNTTVRLFSMTGRRIAINRCWIVNLSRANEVNILSLTRVGTTATLESTSHGLVVNDWIRVCGVSNPEISGDAYYNGVFQVASVVDANHITYTMSGTPTNSPASLNEYKACYLKETTTTSIAIFRGVEFNASIPTFESVVDNNTFLGFDSDLSYLGDPTVALGNGLMVYHLISRNNFNSISPDYSNNAANLLLLDATQCMIWSNNFNAPSCNLIFSSSNGTGGVSSTQTYSNYWDGGNTGRARIRLKFASTSNTFREATIDNNCIRDTSSGSYWFEGYLGSFISLAASVNNSTNKYTFNNDILTSNGKGIDYSAYIDGKITGTTTNEVLKDYEEGTWTPVLSSFTIVGTPTVTGIYIKVGQHIYFSIKIVPATSTACTAGTSYINLPYTATTFASANVGAADITTNIGLNTIGVISASTNFVFPPAWGVTGNTIVISGTYRAST